MMLIKNESKFNNFQCPKVFSVVASKEIGVACQESYLNLDRNRIGTISQISPLLITKVAILTR